jgi:tetratricopeptide (TPR) repeat protein
MGLAQESNGALQEAERYYLAALKADQQGSRTASLWSRAILARLYLRGGRYQEATVLLQQLLESDPEYAFGVGLQGELMIAQHRYAEAAASFQRAFIASRDPIYLYQSAQAYKQRGDTRSWREALDATIAVYQKDTLIAGTAHQATLDKALHERASGE